MKSPRIIDKITSIEHSRKIAESFENKPEPSFAKRLASIISFLIIYGVGAAFVLYLLWLILIEL